MKSVRLLGWTLGVFLLLGVNSSIVAAALPFEWTMGVNHHFTVNTAKDIADTRNAGFRLIRYDMTWEAVESQKGQYNFQTFDRLLA